ncbi:hypothetical protein VTJ83DRAFT_2392 [Remersonia thermophila]|uniref:Glycosyltransferase family 28 N-terminal domain-containing protein n=1 Tax=Remersonia thermophila TaxID=72144 RepID=A0ABR4DIK6_9PEZI
MSEQRPPRRIPEDPLIGRTNTVPIEEEFDAPDADVPPPAYGDYHDQVQVSKTGFNANAAVTADGRINIHINEKNSRLAELLAPALTRQLRPETQPLSSPAAPLPPAYIPPSLGGQPGQTPPPRLNVVIQIVGSRGDVQPFVALGQVLRDTYGHRVRLATHATFKSFVEENGLEFFNIGGDPAQLMAFMVKNPGLLPGLDSLKSGDIRKRRREIQEILNGCWRSCIEAGDGMDVEPSQRQKDEPAGGDPLAWAGDPKSRPFVADAIIANPPSFAHIHIAEKLGIPLHVMFTMPWTPTKSFPHPLADIVATNTDAAITNYVSYALVEMLTWQGLGDVINRFRTNTLELEPISLMWGPGLLTRLRIPTTYCWSPALTPKPADWPGEISVSGFYFLNLESAYAPDPALAAFLAAGPPPVYIGFGSIVVDDPDKLTRTIFGAILKSGVRAIVSKGWGGIGADAHDVPDGVFMLGNCPHDWLFKRVSAVVHHGGAGTTAAGILAGRPTVVVPFFGDQIFWGSMVARAGAGPAPIPFKKLTAEKLAGAIELALRPETQARAAELGDKIKQEKGADVGGTMFHQRLDADKMRCSLAPSRVAVWRVRRSQVRLSAMAAAALVKQGWLKHSDLKLYRPVEYNTDDQPWDPISAVVVALLGDMSNFTMALADFPREVFHRAHDRAAKKGMPKNPPTKDGPAQTYPSTLASASGTSLASASTSHRRVDSASETTGFWTPPPGTAAASVESLPISQASTAGAGLSPQATRAAGAASPRSPAPASDAGAASPKPSNLDVAVAAGKGVGRIAGASMKFYTNTCLGLARGFRNAPKLYNDDTVRPVEKVTGLASGFKVAGKEFGLGFYDGLAGLVTQPLRGAEKEGRMGFVKGMGKGLGGVFLKTASAMFALPAYTAQGVSVEVRNRLFARGSTNYIIASRVRQGEEELAAATAAEARDVLLRWHAKRDELKGYYLLKQKEKDSERAQADAAAAAQVEEGPKQEESSGDNAAAATSSDPAGGSPNPARFLGLPRESWYGRRSRSRSNSSNAAATDHHAPSSTATCRGAAPGSAGPASSPTHAHAMSTSSLLPFDPNDAEALERAIREAVEQTSTGDREEDARIEAAVRASVLELARVAEQQQQQQQQLRRPQSPSQQLQQASEQPPGYTPPPGQQQQPQQDPGHGWIADQKRMPHSRTNSASSAELHPPPNSEDWTNVTDEEYQALIEEAVRQSMQQHELEMRWRTLQRQQCEQWGGGDEEAIEDVVGASQTASTAAKHSPSASLSANAPTAAAAAAAATAAAAAAASQPTPATGSGQAPQENRAQEGEGEDEEAQLRRALEESEREYRARADELARQKTEEEIVLEYVKRQSLAEEEFRRRRNLTEAGKGKGVAHGQGGERGMPGTREGEEDDEDEELRRAIEESLRVSSGGSRSGGGGDGPSFSR